MNVLQALWHTLGEMAPYLLMGFLISGLLSVWLSPETVEKHLGRGRFFPVLKASLFGVPLPLCSCSVIPVAASLRRHGAGRPATAAFLISTPQTGVDSIFVTYSLLGLPFAFFRTVVAFLSGLLGGLAVAAGDREEDQERPAGAGPAPAPAIPALQVAACCSSGGLPDLSLPGIPALAAPPVVASATVDAEASCCCIGSKRDPAWKRALRHGFITIPRDLAQPLLIGLLAAGLIAAFVPADYFAASMGTGFGAKVLMLLIGIPVYVCATASVPIAAAFIGAGISPGAALVFLMAGPATNAATLATIWKLLGRRAASLYLTMVAATALGAGMLFDRFRVPVALVEADLHGEHISPWRSLFAVLLLAVLLLAWTGKRRTRST